MTKISFDTYNERFVFEASGHASEYNGSSDGAVCAAISILLLSAAQKLCDMDSDGEFINCSVTVQSGYVCFDVEAREESREKVEHIFDLLMCGLDMLEENYPELVMIS